MVEELVVDKIGFIFAMVEVVKGIDKQKLLENWYPVISMLLGVIMMIILTEDPLLLWRKILLEGMAVGLGASGLYGAIKTVKNRK